MNKKEQFYAELKGVYAYLYQWKETIERNRNTYNEEDYKFQLDVLQSLRGQLKFYGNMTWNEIEKTYQKKDNLDLTENYEERFKRVSNILNLKDKTNYYYDECQKLYDEMKETTDIDKKEAQKREMDFLMDAYKSSNYKFEEAIIDPRREKIKDILRVIDSTNCYGIDFDPFTVDDKHIVLKSVEDLKNDRLNIFAIAIGAFDHFDETKKDSICKLLLKLYDSYIEDAKIVKLIENKKVRVKEDK